MISKPLNRSFYQLPTLELACALLGKLLVKETIEGIVAGYIVETEAYKGPDDRAAHSFGNRRTNRTEVMFGPPGYFYVYQMHTHHLINVVSGQINKPEAVLIRALEPFVGMDVMFERRGRNKNPIELTNGPGKLTKALHIDKMDDGHACNQKPLFIAEGKSPLSIMSGPRIGIDNSGEAKDYPWRFWIDKNNYVSKRKR